MNKHWIIIIVAGMFFTACKNTTISENEKKGMKEVQTLYGGKLKYSTGDSAADQAGEKKFFQLELSGSKFVDKYYKTAELPASGMAYAFYKKLGDDKNKYTDIKSVLVLSGKDTMRYDYKVAELELVQSKVKIAEKIAQLIKNKDYEALKPLLSDSTVNKNDLIENIKSMEAQLGNAGELVIIGYQFYNVYGKDFLQISAQVMRDTKSNAFTIVIDPNDRQERALTINYTI